MTVSFSFLVVGSVGGCATETTENHQQFVCFDTNFVYCKFAVLKISTEVK